MCVILRHRGIDASRIQKTTNHLHICIYLTVRVVHFVCQTVEQWVTTIEFKTYYNILYR